MTRLARSPHSLEQHEIHFKVRYRQLFRSPRVFHVFWVSGQVVTRLEYQAYSKLAVKTMSDIFSSAHANATRSEHAVRSGPPVSPLLHCVVHHRLGVVSVGEASIVIAVSSPHRNEAFVACEYLLEQVKLNVPIWKKEVYESGEPRWKANHPPPTS